MATSTEKIEAAAERLSLASEQVGFHLAKNNAAAAERAAESRKWAVRDLVQEYRKHLQASFDAGLEAARSSRG